MLLGLSYLRIAIEEHGSGKQFVRFRSWPHCSLFASVITTVFGLLSMCAVMDKSWSGLAVLGSLTLISTFYILHDCGRATTIIYKALKKLEEKEVDKEEVND